MSNDKLVWLTINSNAPGKQGHGSARNQSAKTEYGIANVVLLDETGKVGRSYGALKTPHMFVIDARACSSTAVASTTRRLASSTLSARACPRRASPAASSPT